MDHFSFRLESLLHVRVARRDRFRLRLARAMEDEQSLDQRQRQLDRQREQLIAQRREVADSGQFDIDVLIECARFGRLIDEQADRIEQQRRRVAFKIARRRKTLLAAEREVQGLEKLQERQRATHNQRQKRDETNGHDEVASIRHAAQVRSQMENVSP